MSDYAAEYNGVEFSVSELKRFYFDFHLERAVWSTVNKQRLVAGGLIRHIKVNFFDQKMSAYELTELGEEVVDYMKTYDKLTNV